jgi:hypothetical protein
MFEQSGRLFVEARQFVCDRAQGVVPCDRPIVRGTLVQDHRMRQPPLLTEPPVVVPVQLGDRVLGEELGSDAANRRLFGDGLGAVLAELRDVTLVLFGPRASGAVEAVLLVDLQQGLRGSRDAHLVDRDLQGVHDRRDADSDLLGPRDVHAGFVNI